jgi:ribosomal protein S24E
MLFIFFIKQKNENSTNKFKLYINFDNRTIKYSVFFDKEILLYEKKFEEENDKLQRNDIIDKIVNVENNKSIFVILKIIYFDDGFGTYEFEKIVKICDTLEKAELYSKIYTIIYEYETIFIQKHNIY